MNTHDIELPPLPYPYNTPSYRTVGVLMQKYAIKAIEADRKRSHSEAQEVCAEAYQVVGSLLSDLGIFETDRAVKILDNLSQARMVHKDVLPWQSYDRQRRGEPIAWVKPDTVENQFINMRPRRVWWECNEGIGVAIYTTPQPTEPSAEATTATGTYTRKRQMTNKTVLTDEQIDAVPYIGKLSEKGLREFARAIEQAVLQSPEIQTMRNDAERYRYLKKGNHWIVAATQTGFHVDGEDLDDLIDGDIKAGKEDLL